MTRAERDVARMRRHREELTLAFANGWPLERARAEMARLRNRAAMEALDAAREARFARPAPDGAPVARPRQWWQDQ